MELGCTFAPPANSSPVGLYGCTPYGYNGLPAYHRTDGNVTWEIKWERARDFGGSVLGKGAGEGGKPKWTLGYRTANETYGVRLFYVVSEDLVPPGGRHWVPRTAASSAYTSPQCSNKGNCKLDIVGIDYQYVWRTGDRRTSCDTTCEKNNEVCSGAALSYADSLVDSETKMLGILRKTIPGASLRDMTCTRVFDEMDPSISALPLYRLSQGLYDLPDCRYTDLISQGKCSAVPPAKSEPFTRLCYCVDSLVLLAHSQRRR